MKNPYSIKKKKQKKREKERTSGTKRKYKMKWRNAYRNISVISSSIKQISETIQRTHKIQQ
jgi:hypothetical protein